MKTSIKKGFGFGLTSGIITTLGLMVGLESGTNSALAVVSGILVIAVADAFSDALGMHISEESENHHSQREIWESTVATFISKFIFALSFIISVLIFNLKLAIIVSIVWGLLLISIFSYYISKGQKVQPYKVVLEHLLISILVIACAHYLGAFIKSFFN